MSDSERANQSIHQLSNTLEQLSQGGEEVEVLRGNDGTTMSEEDNTTLSRKTQSEAGNYDLLCDNCPSNTL